jgi:hypothetical protein
MVNTGGLEKSRNSFMAAAEAVGKWDDARFCSVATSVNEGASSTCFVAGARHIVCEPSDSQLPLPRTCSNSQHDVGTPSDYFSDSTPRQSVSGDSSIVVEWTSSARNSDSPQPRSPQPRSPDGHSPIEVQTRLSYALIPSPTTASPQYHHSIFPVHLD